MSETSVTELVSSSGLVFTGTVSEVGASTVSGIPVNTRTIVVTVNETLNAPAGVNPPVGARITVQLSQDLPPLQEGEQQTFFTTGWVYGDSLAVTEVGRMPVEETAARTAAGAGRPQPGSLIETALAELAQTELLQHARTADAVVSGKVISLAEVAEPPSGEHDPDWWIATLRVDMVEKGDVPGLAGGVGNVAVLYANSQDVHWYRSPKPKASQTGAWLLHRTVGDTERLAPFQILHPLDLQPSAQIEFFRQLGL